MIFVLSIGGISYNFVEVMVFLDLVEGVKFLVDILYELVYK